MAEALPFIIDDIPSAPQWLFGPPPPANNDNVTGFSPVAVARPAQVVSNAPAYGASALATECASIRDAAPGSRNETFNRAAFSVAQLVHAGMIPEMEARDDLQLAALACGLDAREIQATLNSAFRGAASRSYS